MSALQFPKYLIRQFPKASKQLNNAVENTESPENKGYTYNKDNNSFAIGTKTIASGNDQFVFGRNNIEDDSKVEIVGNSETKEYEEEEYKFDIEKIKKIGSRFEIKLKRGTTEYIHKGIVVANSIEDYIKYLKTHPIYYPSGECYINLETVNVNLEDFHTYGGDNAEAFAIFDPRYQYDDFNFGCISEDSIMKWGNINLDERKILTLDELITENGAPEVVTRQINIRTLDWNGNEEIEGNFTAKGGTITVGNTSITEAQLTQLLALLNTTKNTNKE